MPRSAAVETPNVHFIIPEDKTDKEQCSTYMHRAFQSCADHMLEPEWIQENICLEIKPTKKDVFVCEKFAGRAFQYFREFKSVLLGPRCILTCLSSGVPIPRGENAIFSMAMHGLVITLTGFAINKEKKSLSQMIGFMGGIHVANLLKSSTHVVVNSVRTQKCEKAMDRELTCVTAEWVTSIWEATQDRDIHATDEEFLVHKCKPFHNLTISLTNFRGAEKEKLKKLIIENGGIFHPNLDPESTQLLIVANTSGEKYKAAVELSIPRLSSTWLYDAVNEGHAIHIGGYTFGKRGCSTPNSDVNTRFLPDISTMSAIQCSKPSVRAIINETRLDDTMASNVTSLTTIASKGLSRHLEVVQNLDLKEAEKAGAFLDGCNIYLSGFPLATLDKLRHLLKWGQATKFNEISDSVSHVIIGDVVLNDVKALKACVTRPHVVNVDWLVESMKRHSPAPEEQFLCFNSWPVTTEPPSPSLKKGLQMLQTKIDRTISNQESNVPVPKVGIKDQITQPPDSLIPQYLNKDETFQDLGGGNLFRTTKSVQQQNRDRPSQSESTYVSQADTTILGFFEDLTFLIVGFDEDMREHLQELVTKCSGTVVGNKFLGIPDYAVVPFNGAVLRHTTDEIVSYLWLEDCHDKAELVPLEYFHRPVTVPENFKPLSGCVMGITSYVGRERDFIIQLTEALGAIAQDVLSRRVCIEKNAKATTHLICLEPGSQKYTAAIKWKLPAVTHEWVLACLKEGKKMGLKPYLVGDSTAPLEELEDSSKPMEQESTLPAVRDTSKSGAASNSSEVKKERTPPATREPSNISAIPRLTSVEQESTPLTTRPKANSSTITGSGLSSIGRASELPTSVSSKSGAEITAASLTYIRDPFVTPPPVPEVSPFAGGKNLISKVMGAPLNTGVTDTPVNTSHHYGFSQETPLNISRIRAQTTNSSCLRRAALTPKLEQQPASSVGQITPITAKPPGYIETPETPYGLGTDPSPETRKKWIRWVNKFPDLKMDDLPPGKIRRDSTPLSELYRKCWAKLGADLSQETENTQTTTQSAGETNDPETPIHSARKRLSINESPDSSHPLAPVNFQASGTTGIITQLANLNELLASPRVQQPSSKKRTSAALESDDCKRVEESREILAKIPRETSIKEVAWTYDASQAETATTYKFMLSTLEEEDREKYTAIITRLTGSVVVNDITFDPTATHLVSTKLSRSEKLLASIASGKWVLHKEYLDISNQHGCFVKEEPYEWGNSATLRSDEPKTLISDLARSSHYWRKKLAESGREGAFKGIRAIMATDMHKEGPLKRLIIAGGGTLANTSPPFTETDDATHCFIETGKIRYKVDLPSLIEKGVWCVPPIFLSNCLIQFPPPDPAASQIPEVKHYLDELKKQT